MSEWRDVTLGEVATVITKGTTPTTLGRPFTADGVKFVKVESISEGGSVLHERLAYIDLETHALLRRSQLQQGDILFSIAGAIGRAAQVEADLLPANTNQALAVIRVDDSAAHPRYVYYYLRSQAFQQHGLERVVQTAQANVSLGVLRQAPIALPPRTDQEAIAAILSTLDDLIENNRRRIALVEEMAQAVYREWFVHFRYPGHEDDEFADSPLGPIPAGWSAMTLGEVANTQYGFTDSATHSSQGPKFLRVTDINKRSYISWPDVPHCSPDAPAKFRLAKGDVVIARMADPGKLGIVERDLEAVFASYLVRVRPAAPWLHAYYLYFVLSATAYQEFVLGASTGTTRKSISAKVMEAGPIIRPPEAILDAFVEAVTPLREGITRLAQLSETLVRSRDLLLPKLVTGAIDVSKLDLDAFFEESAA